MKNKFLVAMLIASLLAGSMIISAFAATAQEDDIVILNIGKSTMLVNGVVKEIDMENKVTPVLVKDTTMVPISAIIESFGGKAKWDGKEKKITISYSGKVVELWLNKNSAMVDGTKMNVKVAPESINGRTMVPLKFVSESLGLCVNWEGSTKSILISTLSDYIAIVGNEKIKRAEYNIFLSRAKSEIINYLSQNTTSQTPEGSNWDVQINGTKAGDLAKKMALDYAGQYKIFLSKAKENKVALSAEEMKGIDTSISNIIEQEGSKTAAEKKIMEYYNVNILEYTEFLKENELINKYLQDVSEKIEISEDDIAKYYESNKSSYDTVTVKHILLSTTDDQGAELTIEKQEEVKKKAEEILLKVKAGEDFASLAKQYSSDPGSKDNGGEYTFTRGQMIKEFEDWSFQAKTGDVGIVKTAYGYHIMKFVGKSTFEDVQESIRNTLANEELNSLVNQMVSDPKNIVIKNQSVYDAIEIK